MIYSYDIEKQVLAGILQCQHKWPEVSNFLKDEDFYSEDSKVNISIFRLLKQALDNAEAINETILIQRINQLKISFPDSIDIGEYILSFGLFKLTDETFEASIKELKKLSVRRGVYAACKKVAAYVKKADPSIPYSELVDTSDKLYNEAIQNFESVDKGPINLFELMEPMIEERGNNPVEEFGLMGPHPRINELYGSLLRGGNISVVVARAKVGKTQFCMDFATKICQMHNVPVLHFDNGEMSEEELIMRQMSAMTGIPTYFFETGKWRKMTWKGMSSAEVVDVVRASYKKVRGMRFYYENVAGMSPDEMVSLLKRFYYSKIGRGNDLVFSFDYIKSDFSNLGKTDGWQQVAYMVHRFKQCIQRELSFDGYRPVSMLTSVQSNRLGITRGRNADDIIENESVVSLSDGITQFCSQLFLLRKKLPEEIHEEGSKWGTHKLINLAARHLGSDPMRAINPVQMPDGSHKDNYINLNFENFSITEKGDLLDWVNSRRSQAFEPQQTQAGEEDGIPMVLTNE